MKGFLKQFTDLNPKTGVYRMVPKFLPYMNSFQHICLAFGLFIGDMISDNGDLRGRSSV